MVQFWHWTMKLFNFQTRQIRAANAFYQSSHQKKEPVWMIFPLDFEIRRFTHTVKFIDSSQISSAVIFSEDREGFFHYFTNVSRMSCDRLRQRLQCNYYIWLLLLSLIKLTSSKMPSNLTLQRLSLQVMDWTNCSMRLPPWKN